MRSGFTFGVSGTPLRARRWRSGSRWAGLSSIVTALPPRPMPSTVSTASSAGTATAASASPSSSAITITPRPPLWVFISGRGKTRMRPFSDAAAIQSPKTFAGGSTFSPFSRLMKALPARWRLVASVTLHRKP